jgi:transposase
MSTKRFTEEFKVEAVGQVVDKGYRVADVAARLGVSQHSLYEWIKRRRVPAAERQAQATQSEEVRRLKAELKRVTEERDILKKAAAYFAKQSG